MKKHFFISLCLLTSFYSFSKTNGNVKSIEFFASYPLAYEGFVNLGWQDLIALVEESRSEKKKDADISEEFYYQKVSSLEDVNDILTITAGLKFCDSINNDQFLGFDVRVVFRLNYPDGKFDIVALSNLQSQRVYGFSCEYKASKNFTKLILNRLPSSYRESVTPIDGNCYSATD